MNVGIFFNRHYESENLPNVELIMSQFRRGGSSCRVIGGISDLDGLDVLFVLGGDGTILTVAAACAERNVKIIGINYGHMGFLAEFEPEKLDEAVKLVASEQYEIQNRSLLSINFGGKSLLALNDCVIQRETGGHNFLNTVSLHAEIDGDTVDNVSSDGIIVSTPTGSTAYSLSAGGSILSPDIGAFILTPICAHTLHSKPIVYNDCSTLVITPSGAAAPLSVIVDGRIEGSLSEGESVSITKAAVGLDFITKNKKNFFTKLLIKLSKWSK